MAISVTCDDCFTAFDAPAKAAGKRVRCPTCGSAVRVGAGQPAPTPAAAAGRTRRTPAAAGGSGPALPWMIGGGVAVLLAVGAGVAAMTGAFGGGDGPAAVAEAGDARRGFAPPDQVVRAGEDERGLELAAKREKLEALRAAGRARAAARSPATSAPDGPAAADVPAGGGFADAGTAAGGFGAFGTAGSAAPDEPADAAPADTAAAAGAPGSSAAPADADGLPPERTGRAESSRDLSKRVMPSVVRIKVVTPRSVSGGSGYVVHSSGVVVTNYHVVTEGSDVEVEFEDGTKVKSPGYLLVAPQYDTAVIKIDLPAGKELVPIPLARVLPEQATDVMAFGTPLGARFSTTRGVVGGIRGEEEFRGQVGMELNGTWIQHDASISSGNSGGPLVDYRGNVVAMNTLASGSGGEGVAVQNLNFSVSSVDVLKNLREALDRNELKPWDAGALQEYDKSIERKLVENEQGTIKGRRLLAQMTQMSMLAYRDSTSPEAGAANNAVLGAAQIALNKAGLELLYEEPERVDFGIMLLKIDIERAPNPNVVRITLYGEVCLPDIEDKSHNDFCRVWHDERVVGTATLGALSTGRLPKAAERSTVQFFKKFRRDFERAQRELDAGELDGESGEIDGEELARSGGRGLFEEWFGPRLGWTPDGKGRSDGDGQGDPGANGGGNRGGDEPDRPGSEGGGEQPGLAPGPEAGAPDARGPRGGGPLEGPSLSPESGGAMSPGVEEP